MSCDVFLTNRGTVFGSDTHRQTELSCYKMSGPRPLQGENNTIISLTVNFTYIKKSCLMVAYTIRNKINCMMVDYTNKMNGLMVDYKKKNKWLTFKYNLYY